MNENRCKKIVKSSKNKETRWDRIRKKHMNSVNITTENVRKFFGMDFINEHQLRILNGESKRRFYLNPALVMNARHEMIRRNSKDVSELPPHHFDALKSIQMEKIKNHNNIIEAKYLDHELNKFRKEISMTRTRLLVVHDNIEHNSLSYKPIDNSNLMSSFSHGHECVEDFYRESENATLIERRIFENIEHQSDEVTLNAVEEDVDSIDDLLHSDEMAKNDDRYVRFGHLIEIINYDEVEGLNRGKCSDEDQLSNSIADREVEPALDSNADREIEPILEVKLVPKQQIQTAPTLELIGKQMQHSAEIVTTKHQDEKPVKMHSIEDNCDDKLLIDQNPFIIRRLEVANQSKSTVNEPNVDTDNYVPPEQNAIVSDLFTNDIQTDMKRQKILQKYFLKWIHFTTIERLSKENISCNQSRIQKIEAFLNNIRLEKKKQLRTNDTRTVDVKKKVEPENSIVLARKYHHKLKIQQDIIELQKLKLERQERMISELKLSKLTDDAKESKATIKDELKNVIRNGCANSRAKARCLQIVANVRDDEDDEYAKLQARGVPKFLIEMEQRAMERNRKHQEAKDRREQLEKEKEELRLAAEEAKRLQDEEAKRKRIEELREKRRQEKLAKIQKENERLKQIENNKKATAFYRHMLLSRFGMNGFKLLIKIKKRNERKAEIFHRQMIVRNSFHGWKLHVYNVWNYRKMKADNHFNRQLLKKCFFALKKNQLNQHSKMLVAMDWYDLKLTERMFHIWVGYTKMEKILDEIKMRQAEAHYDWHLKWRVIDHWQRLQTILKIEKETDERRQRWRMKIWELLPDYTPNRDN
ncbi:calponin homology domain-containing protein DDB_G0272472 [Bradysia coprophila]|uniref:calponin homology domain-containing protein DDB_G0272472 n=1 Tax=Bradysia coprophila TaxID=38358 RepID=UPI00187D8774|nr:calponin homology domain-containing protein DDB_G0272472 [Bradysia coprophila]